MTRLPPSGLFMRGAVDVKGTVHHRVFMLRAQPIRVALRKMPRPRFEEPLGVRYWRVGR